MNQPLDDNPAPEPPGRPGDPGESQDPVSAEGQPVRPSRPDADADVVQFDAEAGSTPAAAEKAGSRPGSGGSMSDSAISAAMAAGPATAGNGANGIGASASATTTTASTATPPRNRDGMLAWLIMAICLLVASLPLLLDIHRGDLLDPEEARVIAISVETWRDLAHTNPADHPLMPPPPRLFGQLQVEPPPGIHWIHLQMYRLFRDQQTVTGQQLIRTARISSVMLTLLAIAAVFWAGYGIGGIKTGSFAAMICLSTPFVLYHGRIATSDAACMAFIALSMAAALWAMRPLRPAAPFLRQAVGWAICGLALGMTILSGEPMAGTLVILPLMLIICLCARRFSHILGLLAALFIAALLLIPWTMYLHEHQLDRLDMWFREWNPAHWRDWSVAPSIGLMELLLLLIALLPWTLWLMAALAQPLSSSSQHHRQRMFIGWLWFICLLAMVCLVLPIRWDFGGLVLPLIVGCAIMLAQMFRRYSDMSEEGRYARLWCVLRWPHVLLMALASLLLPLVVLYQTTLVDADYLPTLLVRDMTGFYWFGAGAILLLLTVLAGRFAWRHHPGRLVATTAVWTIAACSLLIHPVMRGPMMQTPVREEARLLAQLIQGEQVYFLSPGGMSAGDVSMTASARWLPDVRLPAYMGKPLYPITAEQMDESLMLDESNTGFMMLMPQDYQPDEAWRDRLQRKTVLNHAGAELWHLAICPTTHQDEDADGMKLD